MSSNAFSQRDLLSTQDAYKAYTILKPNDELEKSCYFPVFDILQLPNVSETLLNLSYGLEIGHCYLSQMNTRDFLKSLALLLYNEFYEAKENKSLPLSYFSPETNFWIYLIKEIYLTVLESTRCIEEIYSAKLFPIFVDQNYTNIRKTPREIEEGTFKKISNKFPDWRELIERYLKIACKLSSSSYIMTPERLTTNLSSFALSIPICFPKLPTLDNGAIDVNNITENVAKSAVERFKTSYKQFPVSPIKRFQFAMDVFEDMHANDSDVWDGSFIHYLIKRYDDKKVNVGPRKDLKCFPGLELLHLPKSLKVYLNNSSMPIELLFRDLSNKPPSQLNMSSNIFEQDDDPLTYIINDSRITPSYLPMYESLANINKLTFAGDRPIWYPDHFFGGWITSGFCYASEILRHILFYKTAEVSNIKKVKVIHKVPFRSGGCNIQLGSGLDLKMEPSVSYPPFIEVQLKPSSDTKPSLEIYLDK